MKNILAILFAFISLLVTVHAQAATQYPDKILHSFTGTDGTSPTTTLTLCGSTLYGVTQTGGSNGNGVVFSVGTDGTNFNVLHNFGTIKGDGGGPQSGLTLCGSKLFGTTYLGGAKSCGCIYSMNLDGSGYQIVYSFGGSSTAALGPISGLTVNGSTLYGTTKYGGSSKNGTIFSINSDGSNFNILHTFSGGSNDGKNPYANLILDGSAIYGVTPWGGSKDEGAIFSMGINGTDFKVLHSFGGTGDGRWCFNGLTLSGNTLYGPTWSIGGIFSIGTDGNGYKILHPATDGYNPYSDFTLVGSTLYGTTRWGRNCDGTVFSLSTTDNKFSIVHPFVGNSGDGMSPQGGLVFDGSTFYGTTYSGGGSGCGTIFSITVPEPSTLILLSLGLASLATFVWRRRK